MNPLTRRWNSAAEEISEADLEATGESPSADTTAADSTRSTSSLALEWTGPAAWITRSLSWVLLASLAAGPMALALGGWMVVTSSAASTVPTSSTSDAAAADDRAAVESFAADFLLIWLTTTTGQESRLDNFLPDLSAVSVPTVPQAVSGVSAAGIEATGDDTWSVTVAATITDAATTDPATTDPAGASPQNVRRYFQVPVFLTADGALIALALPSPIAGPQAATSPKLGYRYPANTSDPIALAAGEFLNALLSGAGDVTRLITPGSPIRALTPPPYAAMTLDDVQVDQDPASINEANLDDGRAIHVLVTATGAPSGTDPATAAQDQGISVQYALTLTARAGRWEVTAIDPRPLTTTTADPADPGSTDSTTEPTEGTYQPPTTSPTAPTANPSSTN